MSQKSKKLKTDTETVNELSNVTVTHTTYTPPSQPDSSIIARGYVLQEILDAEIVRQIIESHGEALNHLQTFQCIDENTFSAILKRPLNPDTVNLIYLWAKKELPCSPDDLKKLDKIIEYSLPNSYAISEHQYYLKIMQKLYIARNRLFSYPNWALICKNLNIPQ